jgi:hypothetical protein
MVLCVCIVVCALAAQPAGRPGPSTGCGLFLVQCRLKVAVSAPSTMDRTPSAPSMAMSFTSRLRLRPVVRVTSIRVYDYVLVFVFGCTHPRLATCISGSTLHTCVSGGFGRQPRRYGVAVLAAGLALWSSDVCAVQLRPGGPGDDTPQLSVPAHLA